MQPLSKIYLHSDTILWDDIKKGNVTHVYSISIAAILYASFKPIDLFRKGNIFSIKTKKRKLVKLGFRELLLILQFTISAILIISTISVTKQINFLKNSNLGYDKKNRIVVQNPWNPAMISRYEVLKQKCLENPAIESVGGCFNYPSSGLNYSSEFESIDSVNKKTLKVGVTSIDVDFFKTVDAHIIEGRNFSKEFATDTSTSIILNETAAKELNLKGSVLGYKLKEIGGEKTYNVIGVAEDIHFFSKKEK